MKKIELNSYSLSEIGQPDLELIYGGKVAYNLGYAVGSAARSLMDDATKAVSWMNDVLIGKIF